jgi:hypothetical protein
MEAVDGQHAASYDPPPGRCPEPGCAVRWRDGQSRPCPDHDPAAVPAPSPLSGREARLRQRIADSLADPVPPSALWPVARIRAQRHRVCGCGCGTPLPAGSRSWYVSLEHRDAARLTRLGGTPVTRVTSATSAAAAPSPAPAVTVCPASAIALAAAPAPAPAIVVSCACGCGELLPSWPPRPGRKFIGSHRKRAARRDERRELRELKAAAAAAVPEPAAEQPSPVLRPVRILPLREWGPYPGPLPAGRRARARQPAGL